MLSMDNATHHLFEQQAAATPDAPAIVSSEGTISYLKLNLRRNGQLLVVGEAAFQHSLVGRL